MMKYETLDSILDVTLYGGLAASGFALLASGSIPGAALTVDLFQTIQVDPLMWSGSKSFVHNAYDWCSDMFFPVVESYGRL